MWMTFRKKSLKVTTILFLLKSKLIISINSAHAWNNMIIFLLSLFLSSAEAASPYTCETTYDQMNIPHVKTTSLEGFYYCFGLNHGQDRAWEMDFFRRVGEGR